MPTNVPTADTMHLPRDYTKQGREGIIFFAISSIFTICGVALLLWLFFHSHFRRAQSNDQHTFIPMNAITDPPRNDLETYLRTGPEPVTALNTKSRINGTSDSPLETAKTVEDAEFSRLFELEKENMKTFLGKKQLKDLEVVACKGKAKGIINSRKNEAERERRVKMSKVSQKEIKGKEGLEMEVAKMVDESPFDDIHEVKGINSEGQPIEQLRVGEAAESSNNL